MQSLYQIETSYQDLFAELESALASQDDDSHADIDQLLKRLDINRDELADKAEAYAAKITEKKARADYLKAESDRLSALAKAELKTAEFLTDRITNALANQDLKKIETNHFKLSLRPSVSVSINCSPDELPDAYQRTTIKTEPDKMSIKKALQAGIEVKGASLIQKNSLVIK